MNAYEVLLDKAKDRGCAVHEMPFECYDGLILGNKIGIRSTIDTADEKADVLAEELSHHELTVGNILDQSVSENRHQEQIAKFHAYNTRIGLNGLIKAFDAGCKTRYEVAEYLETSERFLMEAVECYRKKYGIYTKVDNYIIYFEPNVSVLRLF